MSESDTPVVEEMDDPTAFQHLVENKEKAKAIHDDLQSMINDQDSDEWMLRIILRRGDIPAIREEMEEMIEHGV